MDAKLKKILDELPSKPPRSRLEPYREFIEELRARGRTYRDIAGILAEKCGVQVTGSGIHDFIRTRSRTSGKAKSNAISKPSPNPYPAGSENTLVGSSSEEVQRRIAEIKARGTATKAQAKMFEFNPDEPLKLKKSKQE